jgi:uroporphyrin-III C-methyltransferase
MYDPPHLVGMDRNIDQISFTAALTRLTTDQARHQPATPGTGKIYIVGAGPGDPELLTVKAMRVLQAADVVVYDKLVGRGILDLARADAEKIFVGKTRGNHSVPQDEISALLVSKAQAGFSVVRLKGGDPFIFGRGGEELEVAQAANVAVDVIPGITAALGCAAQAKIPLTHRDHASAVTFVAGQCRDLAAQDWRGLAAKGRTLVIYMGLNGAGDIADKLMADGLEASTPVAVIENGTRRNARVVQTSLADLTEIVQRYGFGSPSLLVVGDVATFAQTNVTEPNIWDLIMKAEA